MEFFIDTGIIAEIEKANKLGIIDGVTTNPSLVAKAGMNQIELIKKISEIVEGPISAEVNSTQYAEMLEEALVLAKIHSNVVIKLPLTQDGLRVCKQLTSKNIKTNVTLCFSANQALLAAKCGATYISPFIGRLDDVGTDGMQLIQDIRQIYDNYGFTTKILAASIRHPEHVRMASLAGADVATIPLNIIEQLYQHPLTKIGLDKFLADYQASLKK